ncbi:MAG: orotidine-5'-phosphate decarboxylase [Candidatus Bathyarchaeia archaeon]
MGLPFLEKVQLTQRERRSLLCVGLDPALPAQRREHTIDRRYLEGADENEARLSFCLEIIEATKDYACAFKPNQQYLLGFSKKEHSRLSSAINKAGAVSILDCKLGDLADSVESALFHIRGFGYDALTVNPLLGNLEALVTKAHSGTPSLGILVLTLTSNPEAARFMKNSTISGKPLYLAIAEDIRTYDADGAVVGATSHVTKKDMKVVRDIIGAEKLILVPGIGYQEGNLEIVKAAAENVLVNVSRDIIYSKDPGRKAEEYCARLRSIFSDS